MSFDCLLSYSARLEQHVTSDLKLSTTVADMPLSKVAAEQWFCSVASGYVVWGLSSSQRP